MAILSTEHNGVEIHYRERDNCWVFELRGREKTAPSLTDAREAINKVPRPKAERFEAYYTNPYSRSPEFARVTVGAYVEGYKKGAGEFWVTGADGKRSKIGALSLLKTTPGNDVLIAEIQTIAKQAAELQTQISERIAKLERIDQPHNEEPE